jgi:hypothetical protein
MSKSRFKVSAWPPDGNHVEEELGEFANLVVATECWHVFVGYYANRRMTLRHGARVIREHVLQTERRRTRNSEAGPPASTTPDLTQRG